MNGAARQPQWRTVLFWLATTVGSAAIGIVLKATWDAPRPTTELISVELTSPATGVKISLPPALVTLTDSHMYFTTLESSVTMKQVDDAIAEAKSSDNSWLSLDTKIDTLIELLKTRAGPVESRRVEFLQQWAEGTNSHILDNVVETIAYDRQDKLPQAYLHHPKDAQDLSVKVSDNAYMNLSEIDESRVAQQEAASEGPIKALNSDIVRKARRTNLLRRLWIYLEPSVFIPILEDGRTVIDAQIKSSQEIARRLTLVVAEQNPPKLIAKVLVTNRGSDPLPVRHIGAILLRVPSRDGGAPSTEAVKLAIPDDTDIVSIIEGGKAAAITFTSVESVAELVRNRPGFQATSTTEDPQASRLAQLFSGGGISAAVRLARAGVSDATAPMGVSEYKPVGPQSREGLYNALLKPSK